MQIHYSRTPSLEVSWLPLSDRKGLPTPLVAFGDFADASGYFLARGIRYDEFESTGARDVLLLSTVHGPRPATLAHEHRHFQQHYIPGLPRIFAAPALQFGDTVTTWRRAIRAFYLTRDFEMDALRYERRLAVDEVNTASFEALLHA